MQHVERKMPEIRAMTKINPLWFLLVTAIAVMGAVLINYQLLAQQQRFEALQNELKRTSARVLELEQHAVRISFDREDAIRGRLDLLDKDGAHSMIADGKRERSWPAY